MTTCDYFVGLDLGSEQFYAAAGRAPWRLLVRATAFPNTAEGFDQLLAWLGQHAFSQDRTVLCMEATGVYGEKLAHFLVARGFRVAIEPPLKVKRAFAPSGSKTDAVDSQQIAEYACRFIDELHLWQPRPELLEQVQVLLTMREQLTTQRTAHQNALHALRRKAVRTPFAEELHQQVLDELRSHLKELDQQLEQLIAQDPPSQHFRTLLLTIPGVGLLLATHWLVLWQTFHHPTQARHCAAYLGISPREHQSGKSVHAKPTSRHYGPATPRKLLHLAARSVVTHKPAFRTYYQRKLAEGKPKKVALNNVANKLVKIACAVLVSGQPYDPNYCARQPLAQAQS